MKSNYIFLNKALYLKKEKILAVGDLHLGYERAMKEAGFEFPIQQLKSFIEDFKNIFEKLKEDKMPVDKIIFLGDIKHFFSYNKVEDYVIKDFVRFLEKYVSTENIIFIRGNHDKIQNYTIDFQDYYLEGNIAFIHGHKEFPETSSQKHVYSGVRALDDRESTESKKDSRHKKIKTLIMGHVHPSVVLSDNSGVKKEKYKCFLVGKWAGKEIFILPSFMDYTKGTGINVHAESYISIIPEKILQNFRAYVISDEGEVLDFGKVKNLE